MNPMSWTTNSAVGECEDPTISYEGNGIRWKSGKCLVENEEMLDYWIVPAPNMPILSTAPIPGLVLGLTHDHVKPFFIAPPEYIFPCPYIWLFSGNQTCITSFTVCTLVSTKAFPTLANAHLQRETSLERDLRGRYSILKYGA